MSRNRDVSAKGYYYNLEKSPYVWESPYGDSFKLPSRKRLDMMKERTQEETRRLDKLLDRNDLRDIVPPDLVTLLYKYIIQAVYESIVGR